MALCLICLQAVHGRHYSADASFSPLPLRAVASLRHHVSLAPRRRRYFTLFNAGPLPRDGTNPRQRRADRCSLPRPPARAVGVAALPCLLGATARFQSTQRWRLKLAFFGATVFLEIGPTTLFSAHVVDFLVVVRTPDSVPGRRI